MSSRHSYRFPVVDVGLSAEGRALIDLGPDGQSGIVIYGPRGSQKRATLAHYGSQLSAVGVECLAVDPSDVPAALAAFTRAAALVDERGRASVVSSGAPRLAILAADLPDLLDRADIWGARWGGTLRGLLDKVGGCDPALGVYLLATSARWDRLADDLDCGWWIGQRVSLVAAFREDHPYQLSVPPGIDGEAAIREIEEQAEFLEALGLKADGAVITEDDTPLAVVRNRVRPRMGEPPQN